MQHLQTYVPGTRTQEELDVLEERYWSIRVIHKKRNTLKNLWQYIHLYIAGTRDLHAQCVWKHGQIYFLDIRHVCLTVQLMGYKICIPSKYSTLTLMQVVNVHIICGVQPHISEYQGLALIQWYLGNRNVISDRTLLRSWGQYLWEVTSWHASVFVVHIDRW